MQSTLGQEPANRHTVFRQPDRDEFTSEELAFLETISHYVTVAYERLRFIRELRDGHCDDLLAKWEHDYHKKYAHYICKSEAQHPLLSWELVEWEEAPPLIILHYRGERQSNAGQPGTDQELFTVTTEHKGGEWIVTKYDAMY